MFRFTTKKHLGNKVVDDASSEKCNQYSSALIAEKDLTESDSRPERKWYNLYRKIEKLSY